MKQRQDFDSPWKEILDGYFPEFLQFFFAEIHAAIDWSRGHVFLDKEFQKIVRDAEQGRRHIDKLVRVFIDGEETWLLIHAEIQGQPDVDFPERMFVYYYRIFDRYKKDTVSLAVLTDPDPNFRPEKYSRKRFGCRLRFNFPAVKLLDYGKKWEKLESSDNLFALAVMAHLKALELKVEQGEERKRWKLRLVRMLYERGCDRRDVLELFRFIDWLLMLPPELERSFTEEVSKIEEEKGMEYITSVERVGMERGLAQGMQQGSLQEARIMLLETLSVRFDGVPEGIAEIVKGITEYDVLKRLFHRALRCADLHEFTDGLARR
jgi:hypothetical protein